MSQLHAQDHTIDQVLTALRDAPAPAGLEARIAHRLLQAQEAPTPAPTFFAVFLGAARDLRLQLAVATALAVALAIPLTHLHHDQPMIASHTTKPDTAHPTPTLSFRPERDGLIIPRSGETRSSRITTAAQALSTPTPDDPEAIALAETLAPSQPIPTQPLTPQERLLLHLTRQGQPIEVAELELAREPILRAAAEAHERFTFAQVARSLLAPLAEAESLEPKPSSTDAPPAASTELQPPSSR
jgi:hypothetical protein